MESTHLGLVLDSSTAIAAERKKQPVLDFIEAIFSAHGSLELSLSPVTVSELVHGMYRSSEWDICEVVQRMACFLQDRWKSTQPASMYKSKGKALYLYTNEHVAVFRGPV